MAKISQNSATTTNVSSWKHMSSVFRNDFVQYSIVSNLKLKERFMKNRKLRSDKYCIHLSELHNVARKTSTDSNDY